MSYFEPACQFTKSTLKQFVIIQFLLSKSNICSGLIAARRSISFSFRSVPLLFCSFFVLFPFCSFDVCMCAWCGADMIKGRGIIPRPRPRLIPTRSRRPDPEESGPIPIVYESRYSCLSQQFSASARFILPHCIASAIQSDLNLLQCFIVSLPISNESIHSYRTLTYSLSHFPESRCDHIPIA